jgi:uncharacterized protein YaiL (DUF2058 family)
MSNSLRDQLLKAGLATQEHLKRAKASDRKHHRQAKQQKRTGGPAPQTEAARLAAEAAAREKARAQALNRERQAEQDRLAAEAQARDMVVKSEISRPQSEKDVGFNFTHKGKIKQIYVSPELHKQLVAGKLAVCRTRGRYRVVPVEVAQKVQPIAPYLVAFLSDGKEPEDPDYADFPIPDDLMW